MTIDLQKEIYLLKELEVLISRFDIHVRYEHLPDAHSGLCILKGTTYLIIDTGTALEDKLEIFKKILSGSDLTKMYVPPAVREFLSGE
jgi:hypothetical protein